MSATDDKRLAATAAADEVRAGMVVGLGTGSTVAELLPVLAGLVRVGVDFTAVATSVATEAAARALGIRVAPFDDVAAIDLAIDGVDEIDGRLRAIKGAGGAMLREKVIASAARRMVAIADGSKRCATIGARPVPVEVLPFARGFVTAAIERLGARAVLRMAGDAPVRTDQDNLIVDCTFASLPDPAATAADLSSIPGALGHGLFLDQIDAVYFGVDGSVIRRERE